MGAIAGPVVVNTQNVPTRRLIKDILLTGKYVHPKVGWEWVVGADTLQKLAENGNAYLASGGEIEVTVDHSASAEDVIGYIVSLWVAGDRLMALFEFRGQRGIGVAEACQRVSVEVDPDFVDGKGRKWGEMLPAVSLVQKPVVPGQTDFIAASMKGLDKPRTVLLMSRQLSSSSNPEKPVMKLLIAALAALTGNSALTENEAELVAAVNAFGAKLKADGAENTKNIGILESKIADLTKAATSGAISPERKEMLADKAAETMEQLEALNGKTVTITPAIIEKMAASLVPAGDNARLLLLSRNGDKPAPAPEFVKALSLAAKGTPTNSTTGSQQPKHMSHAAGGNTPDAAAEAAAQKAVTNEMRAMVGAAPLP